MSGHRAAQALEVDALGLVVGRQVDDLGGARLLGGRLVLRLLLRLVQGLTLPWLVGRLGVRGDTGREKELERRLAVRAAKAAKRRPQPTRCSV
ncbi:hypothetical protein [Streptomyces sp. S-9]|uniref:hypothetical protein n=1 Tax=Streptomyces sp. S-9 TaxID=2806600 RepID=UPI00193B7DCF|nr:hypothetical protein [Streptomyces sp. S-9]